MSDETYTKNSALGSYYYDQQLTRYLRQMMSIFAGLRVQVGWNEDKEPRLISIPIANASKDRVVAWIKGEQTQNKPLRLPMFSMTLANLNLARDLQKGVGQQRRNTYLPVGGVFPNDIKVAHQYMPVPYRANFELGIWASNQNQHYQIIEQILTLFDPTLQIQTADDILDWTRLTSVELTGIRFEENLPPATDRRIVQTTLDFETVVYMSAPTEIRDKLVKEIYLRIGAVGTDASTSFDIIAELDAEGVQYDKVFDLDNIKTDP